MAFVTGLLAACVPVTPGAPSSGEPPVRETGPGPGATPRPRPRGKPASGDVGNGEAYNGPHLRGLSVPPAPDNFMSSRELEQAAGLCLEQLNLHLLHQAFGDRIAKFQTHTYTGTYPNRPGPDDYVTGARGIVLFVLRDETVTRRLHSWVDTGISGPGAMPKHLGFTAYLELHDERELSERPPKRADRTYWLELSTGLPKLLLDVPSGAPVEREGKLVRHVPVQATGVFLPPRHGAAIPLVDGFSGKPSELTLNTEAFAHCLQNLTQTDGGPPLLAPGGARGEPGPEFSRFADLAGDLLTLHAALPGKKTIAERAAWQKSVWDAHGRTARNLFSAYLRGDWNQTSADHWGNFCALAERGTLAERQFCSDLSYRVSGEIYRASLEQLSAWQEKIPALRELLRLAPPWEAYPRFRVATRAHGGGFFRGPGFIAANLLEVRPEHWWLFFVHELSHAVDDILTGAARRYEAATRTLDAPAGDAAAVDAVVEHGLDRGLRAEWRAWVVTFHVYQEAVRANAWRSDPLIDALLGGTSDIAALEHRLMTFLSQPGRFTDPDDGVFSRDDTRAALKRVRESLRDEKAELPPLGALQRVLDAETAP